MGVVYRAEHAMVGRPVALKVLLAEWSKNEGIVKRFFNEARDRQDPSPRHPGDLRLRRAGRRPGLIAMQLLEGETPGARCWFGWPSAGRRGDRHHPADRRDPGRGPRRRHRSPRPQARQHLHLPRSAMPHGCKGGAARLRHRQAGHRGRRRQHTAPASSWARPTTWRRSSAWVPSGRPARRPVRARLHPCTCWPAGCRSPAPDRGRSWLRTWHAAAAGRQGGAGLAGDRGAGDPAHGRASLTTGRRRRPRSYRPWVGRCCRPDPRCP